MIGQLILIGLMFIGLLFSRAVLSMSMIGAIAIGVLSVRNLKLSWSGLKKHPVFVIGVFLFAYHLLSVFWVKDIGLWQEDIQLKIPLLLFPFAMLAFPIQDKKFQVNALMIMQLVLTAGILYSFNFLIQDWEQFKQGKHFRGPVGNDYLRFAMALILTLNISIYQNFSKLTQVIKGGKLHRVISVVFVVLTFAYLHIQSSKLGLLGLYALILFLGIGFFKSKWGNKIFYTLTVSLIVLMLLAAKFLPVLNHQFSRIEKEYVVWKNNDVERYNDPDVTSFVPRLISYQIAVDLIKERPILGVGAGGVFPEMQEVYAEKYPNLRLVITPHNQPLNTGVALGFVAGLLMLIMLFYPLLKGGTVFERANALVLIIACMVEAMLEIQNGLFIYLFFTYWWIKDSLPSQFQVTSRPSIEKG